MMSRINSGPRRLRIGGKTLSRGREGEMLASLRERVNGSHSVPIVDYSIKQGIEGVPSLANSSEAAVMLEGEATHW
jgi:hypothetical protein